MSNSQNTAFQKMIEIETVHARVGHLPEGDSLQEAIYVVQTKEQNAKKIHALTLAAELEGVDPLTEIRAQIFKGNFVRANQIIEKVKNVLDTAVISELLIQEAKLASYEWQWSKSLILANEALQLEKKLLSRMTLFQIRARALYELGHWRDALQDLENFESLATMFPHSPSIIYANGILVRILARTASADLAETKLESIWAQEMSKGINTDSLYTILRAEIDVRRIQKSSYLSRAIACKMIEAATGEGYFESLADIDIAFVNESLHKRYLAVVGAGAMRYKGIAQLLSEIEGKSSGSISSTARSVVVNEGVDSSTPEDAEQMLAAKQIYFSAQKLLFSVDNLQTVSLEEFEHIAMLIDLLSKGSLHKRDIFTQIWKQKYAAHLHDTLIRNLLYRARTKFNLDIESVKGVISLRGVLYVE